MDHIAYKAGYKYQLAESYSIQTPVTPPAQILTGYLVLKSNGMLHILKGYAWDGASGPTWDTPAALRPSLCHDALYSLMRDGLLPFDQWRLVTDKFFRQLCKEDGMWGIRAQIWFMGVRFGGGWNPEDRNTDPILYAPK